MWLEIEHLFKAYDGKPILSDLNMSLKRGEIACLLGSSGSGKTTALRMIAGFEQPELGTIKIGGQSMFSGKGSVPAHKRHIGVVFQDHALFPHLDVSANIAFGLTHLSKQQCADRVSQLLELTHLEYFAKAYPHELSGGQQQRVSLARAIAPQPKLLLLDEPFSSLDNLLRESLSQDVKDILKAEKVTALMVTHDQHEAFTIADHIGLMHNGKIEQWGSPYQLYHEPLTPYVARFIGQGSFLEGVVKGHQIELELGCFDLKMMDSYQPETVLDVLIRPDDVIHDEQAMLKAVVKNRSFKGTHFIYRLILPSGQELLAQIPSHQNHEVGEAIGICLDLDHLIAFPKVK